MTDTAVAQALEAFFASTAERAGKRHVVRAEATANTAIDLLTFTLDKETFGLNIACVKEICRAGQITAVPRLGPQSLGIMSLRGSIVPVVDLAAILGLTLHPAAYIRSQRIIILDHISAPLGVRVDRVLGVARLNHRDLEPRPYGLQTAHKDWVLGLGKAAKGFITVLDGPALLHHLERMP
jgi:purine-binding chemotaxis protein CheW